MEIVGESGYILSNPELIYLVALTGAVRLLGVRDDTTLLARDKILGHWPEIKNSLHSKKYLDEDPDGFVHIHENLFRCINTCAKPRAYFTCVKHSDHFNCYMEKGCCIKLEQSRSMQDSFVLTQIGSFNSFKETVFDFFVPDGEYVDIDTKIMFTEEQYNDIKNETYEAVHTPENKSKDIANILQNENALRYMVRYDISRVGVNKINIYAAYINENIICRLVESKSKKDAYILKSMSEEKFVGELDEFINTFKRFF